MIFTGSPFRPAKKTEMFAFSTSTRTAQYRNESYLIFDSNSDVRKVWTVAARHLSAIPHLRYARGSGQSAYPGIHLYRYTRTDFDRVLEFVRGLYEPRTPEGLRDHLLPALRTLVPVGFAADASFEVGAPLQGRTQCTDPPGLKSLEADAILARHMPKAPLSYISSAPIVSNSRDGPTCSHCHNFCAQRFTTRCIAP